MTEHVADEPVESTEDAVVESELETDIESGAELETGVDAIPVRVMPDRADAPVSEITERFLRAVVAQIPLERIEELHLFSPLRQSGVETGIAVVAARVPTPPPAVESTPEPELALTEVETGDIVTDDTHTVAADAQALDIAADIDDAELVDAEVDDADVHDGEFPVTESIDGEAFDTEVVEDVMVDDVMAEDVIAEDVIAEDVIAEDVIVDAAAADDDVAEESVMTEHEVSHVVGSEAMVVDAMPDESPYREEETIPDAVVTPIERHTVYTARYRLVQKGPERGKWEADVKAEADAPLITVEMVVRGVQRRAGEESEILRYSASQIARALRIEWPLPTPVAAALESDNRASAA